MFFFDISNGPHGRNLLKKFGEILKMSIIVGKHFNQYLCQIFNPSIIDYDGVGVVILTSAKIVRYILSWY